MSKEFSNPGRFSPREIANTQRALWERAGDHQDDHHLGAVGFSVHESVKYAPRDADGKPIVAPLPKSLGAAELSDACKVFDAIVANDNVQFAVKKGILQQPALTQLGETLTENQEEAARGEAEKALIKSEKTRVIRTRVGKGAVAIGAVSSLYGIGSAIVSESTSSPEIIVERYSTPTKEDVDMARGENAAYEHIIQLRPEMAEVVQPEVEQNRAILAEDAENKRLIAEEIDAYWQKDSINQLAFFGGLVIGAIGGGTVYSSRNHRGSRNIL